MPARWVFALASGVDVGFSLQASFVGRSLDDTERMLYRVWDDDGQIELARLLPGHGVIVVQTVVDPENVERIDRAAASLLEGASAQDVIAPATSGDPFFQARQYGVAALLHEAASFTGSETDAWSGAASDQFAFVQGNCLVGLNWTLYKVQLSRHRVWERGETKSAEGASTPRTVGG